MAATQQRNLFGGGRQLIYPWLLLLPGLGFYLLIGVGPSLATAIYSFTDATGIRNIPISWVGFDNYDEFLFQGARSRDNLDALQRTLIFMVLVTVIQFGIGLVMALLVNQKLRGRLVFRTLFFVPFILGVAVQGLMWKLFLRPGGGPMDDLFGLLGMESQFLAGTNAFYWVIVVQIWANAGFTMVIFLAGMQTIPTDLFEAAAVDGASGWQLFKNVTWPQLTPAVNTNFLLNIIGSLQAWMLFLVLTGYKKGVQVLGYVVYAEAFGQTGTATFRQGYAAAASIVLFILVLVLGMAANAFVTRRERKYL
ncbi:MAG: sugar ABC transporter permease [Acidimicrobiales bacterium]|nr:sugar ABC transporter permease [Acidimicrobiales bacterium]